MPGRNYSSKTYRYGFNGKEKDNEITIGSTYDYGFRIYNPAIGKFLSVDPLQKKYPELTPYQFASNSPIQGVDLDGREIYHYTLTMTDGKPVLKYLGVQTQEKEWWEFTESANDFEDFNGDEITEKSIQVHYIPEAGKGIVYAPTISFKYFKELIDWRGNGFNGIEEMQEASNQTQEELKKAVFLHAMSESMNSEGVVVTPKVKSPKSIAKVQQSSANGGVLTDGQSAGIVGAGYRSMKQKASGLTGKGYDVHHTLPKGDEFATFFKNAGLDVNSTSNTIWRKSADHSSTAEGAAKSKQHLKLWQEFKLKNPNANAKQILNQKDVIEQKVWGNTSGDTPAN